MDVITANAPHPMLSRDSQLRPPSQLNDEGNPKVQRDTIISPTDAVQAAEDVKASENKEIELQQAVDDIATSMDFIQKGLAFKIDKELGEPVVRVIDISTGDLIRQIPNEEALEIAKKLNEVTGLLMKTEV
ncbi:flagellar protein FlaG protein [Shewanella sp. MR-4]|uniref:flagellar protein FlaG n=1 Tax=Shewanella sp. (strain MR-4) TaxID=60480 RepID=UPI00005E5114|nr:flagellar protein FlaG [Shewanella sp. MR-4]ABI38353.1 flagellar protein FlaG protein [Shewanella sp. MR-4]